MQQEIPTYEEFPAILKDGLKIVATNEKFDSYTIECKSGSNFGDGMMGIIVKVVIRGTKVEESHGNKRRVHELSVLCKIQHLSKARREFHNSFIAFEREVLMYKEFLREIQNFQEEKQLENKFLNFPKCFYAEINSEAEEAVIIMEDLRERDFVLVNKDEPLPVDCCELVIEALAKLHAASFSLKDQKPEIYQKFKNCKCLLDKILLQPGMLQMFDGYFDNVISYLGNDHSRIVTKLLHMKENLSDIFKSLINADTAGDFAIVGHGDSWINNFMYKFDGNGKPVELTLIDWQISRYASPVLELSYFIFVCTDKKLRDEHFKRLLTDYYRIFSSNVRQLGSDPEKIFPLEEFERQWASFGKYGLILALCMVPYITMSADQIKDIDIDKKTEELTQDTVDADVSQEIGKLIAESTKRVEGRLKDVVLDMDTLGYL